MSNCFTWNDKICKNKRDRVELLKKYIVFSEIRLQTPLCVDVAGYCLITSDIAPDTSKDGLTYCTKFGAALWQPYIAKYPLNVQFGQTIPPERCKEAADNLAQVFPCIAKQLLTVNRDGMGEQDARDFMDDAQLAVVAIRYVAEFASENCRFVTIKGTRPDG